ncbi:MAG TPA: biotin-dependent carboxyltransferase family protein [Verrucomicrobiae bacterium]|nr:biotin-dependent carboxyltransferase family protein [Verrucomicrobiae bacterium]
MSGGANSEVFEVRQAGVGMTIQDMGRSGWRRFGVPVGGVMDPHAAAWANRLLDNSSDAPVLELLLHGAKLVASRDVWCALVGAEAETNVPLWQAFRAGRGQVIQIRRVKSGLWIYFAVAGGFAAPQILGSASQLPKAGIGQAIQAGDRLASLETNFQLPPGVAARAVSFRERRDYNHPPSLRVWPGPQWDQFGASERERFFNAEWTVSAQSDRVGYRLEGPALVTSRAQIVSEPVRVGSIQIPANGQPIVTMRDGPTVGGYPKLGVVDPADLPWLTQCRPGLTVRFQLSAPVSPFA